MNQKPKSLDIDSEFSPDKFNIANLQDEIRVDELCGALLRFFYLDMVEEGNLPPVQAGLLAHGADYFLREFIIPDRQENIFLIRPGRVRQFAGNWYIIKNLEPNMAELGGILAGVEAFYLYCQKLGRVSNELVNDVRRDCADLDYYAERIERFWAIKENGYIAWDRECSLDT